MALEFELVMPCYNEEKSLQTLVDRALEAGGRAGYGPDRFGLILVENGSKDQSRKVIRELLDGPRGKWFRVVEIDQNQGYGFGVASGLQATRAPIVGWTHADQQCDPADAFRALEKLKAGGTSRLLVKGVRSGRNWKDRWVTLWFETIASVLLGLRVGELNAQPKVFPRELLGELQNPPRDFAFDLYLLFRACKAGYRIETVPVLFPPRVHGLSNWASSFASRRRTILNMIRYIRALAAREGRI